MDGVGFGGWLLVVGYWLFEQNGERIGFRVSFEVIIYYMCIASEFSSIFAKIKHEHCLLAS